MDAPTEITIPVPWGVIAGKIWGKPNGAKVFAVHGKQDNCGAFDRLIPMLQGTYYIIAVDLPGHGHSSHFPSGLPDYFINYIVALRKVIDYYKWESFYYLGHSLGGQIGLFMSSLFPSLIKRLIVLDHFAPEYSYKDTNLDAMRITLQDFLKMDRKLSGGKQPVYMYEDVLEKMMTRDSSLCKEAAEIILKRSLIPVQNGYIFSMDQRIKLNPFPELTFDLMKSVVLSITCPSIIILSTQRLKMYKLVFKDLIEVYKQKKNFAFHIVKGNHDVHQNNPERVVYFIDQFFGAECRL